MTLGVFEGHSSIAMFFQLGCVVVKRVVLPHLIFLCIGPINSAYTLYCGAFVSSHPINRPPAFSGPAYFQSSGATTPARRDVTNYFM